MLLIRLQPMGEEELIYGSVEMIWPLKVIGHGMEKMKGMEPSFGMGIFRVIQLVSFLIIGAKKPMDNNRNQIILMVHRMH